MRIAFFNCFPLSFGGGLASCYEELSAGLHQRYPSISAHCVSFDESTAFILQSIYSAYYLRNEITLVKNKMKNPTAHTLHQMMLLLKQYDLIYTKDDILELTILRLIRLTDNIPPVITGFHTPIEYVKTPTLQSKLHNSMYASHYYRRLLKYSSAFHVLNNFHKKKLHDLFPDIPVVKIHNPINKHLYKLRTTNDKQPTTLKVLWVGRLTKDKGCDDLVRLVNEERRRRIHWTIIGDGAMRKNITNLSLTLSNVTYLPYMDRNTLAKEYKKHDLFISTSKWECLPYTILEAQLCGLPVIAYDIPGCNDIVIPQETGKLAFDFDDLSEKLTTIRVSKFDKKKIRHSALRRFDNEKSYQQMYQLIKHVHEQKLR